MPCFSGSPGPTLRKSASSVPWSPDVRPRSIGPSESVDLIADAAPRLARACPRQCRAGSSIAVTSSRTTTGVLASVSVVYGSSRRRGRAVAPKVFDVPRRRRWRCSSVGTRHRTASVTVIVRCRRLPVPPVNPAAAKVSVEPRIAHAPIGLRAVPVGDRSVSSTMRVPVRAGNDVPCSLIPRYPVPGLPKSAVQFPSAIGRQPALDRS